MAKKPPLITDQIMALQLENERLIGLQKLFNKGVKNEFGMDIKAIHDLIDTDIKKTGNTSSFEEKICSYFELFYESDRDDFLRIMCNHNTLNFYRKQLNGDNYSDDIVDDLSTNKESFSDDENYDYSGDIE